jgi:HAD superfamily hydrolase (TIGR01509 family)
MGMLKGVLLDIDGTLVDSNDAHAHAWQQALREKGIDVAFEKIRRLIGKGGDKLLPEVTNIDPDSPEGEAISKARREIFERDFLPKLRPFPKVEQLLARFTESGLRLAVASSAKKEELQTLLKICGAEKFIEASTSSDDAENSKPDPDIVHAALKSVALVPGEVVLLGDTPYDIRAAHGAKVGTVALRCGGWGDADLAGAIAIYDSPADLLEHYDDSPFHR